MAFRVEDYGPAYRTWPIERHQRGAPDLARGLDARLETPAFLTARAELVTTPP